MRTSEVAAMLGRSERTALRVLRALDAPKVGARWYVPAAMLALVSTRRMAKASAHSPYAAPQQVEMGRGVGDDARGPGPISSTHKKEEGKGEDSFNNQQVDSMDGGGVSE